MDDVKPFYSLLESNHKHIGFPIKGISSADDLAFICFSSGTTGLAKGVMLTHRNLIAQCVQVASFESTSQGRPAHDTVYLGFLPFYHIFGLTSLVIGTIYRAVPIVIMERYNLEQFCQLVQKYKVTNVNIVPPVGKSKETVSNCSRRTTDSIIFVTHLAVHLAKNPVVLKYDLSSLRVMGCGAAPLGREHIEALKRRIEAPVRQG